MTELLRVSSDLVGLWHRHLADEGDYWQDANATAPVHRLFQPAQVGKSNVQRPA
jgi:hypothetical protein